MKEVKRELEKSAEVFGEIHNELGLIQGALDIVHCGIPDWQGKLKSLLDEKVHVGIEDVKSNCYDMHNSVSDVLREHFNDEKDDDRIRLYDDKKPVDIGELCQRLTRDGGDILFEDVYYKDEASLPKRDVVGYTVVHYRKGDEVYIVEVDLYVEAKGGGFTVSDLCHTFATSEKDARLITEWLRGLIVLD